MPPNQPSLGKVEPSQRGFPMVKFQDYYGQKLALKMSSLALSPFPGTSALELIVTGPKMVVMEYVQVGALVEHLHHWLLNGTIDLEDKRPHPAAAMLEAGKQVRGKRAVKKKGGE